MSHDYEDQRRDTVASFRRLKGANLPATGPVDFVFFLEETDADWNALETALRKAGFDPRRDEDGETLFARATVALTPEGVWEKERIATEIALAHDFYPDGWDIVE